MKPGITVIFLFVCIACFDYTLTDTLCPNNCTCQWLFGKRSVDCSGKNLLTIPDNLDPSTQVLNLTSNKFTTLKKNIFEYSRAVNLQKLYLSRCQISTIEKKAFRSLEILYELDLSENSLRIIPTSAFSDTPRLRRLILNKNKFIELNENAFSSLINLRFLEISDCRLKIIHEKAFQGLGKLEWLHLHNNRLNNVKGKELFPESLKGITLYNNLWKCDCHISDFYDWLVNVDVDLYVDPVCDGPDRFDGQIIKTMNKSELKCLPVISHISMNLGLKKGSNAYFVCQVNANPEAKLSWWFQDQPISNNSNAVPGGHNRYIVNEGDFEKKSQLNLINVDKNDDGIFICEAENAAGKVRTNFTIRVEA